TVSSHRTTSTSSCQYCQNHLLNRDSSLIELELKQIEDNYLNNIQQKVGIGQIYFQIRI
ncbi:unnamed protein product, partial [Callosobruchus maculatus]